jgi:hypothetical protein
MVTKTYVQDNQVVRAFIESSAECTILLASDGTIAYASPSILKYHRLLS